MADEVTVVQEPEERYGCGEIVCPYCGYEYADSWEFDRHSDSGLEECQGCGKSFFWERVIDVTYDTAPLKPAPRGEGAPR